MQQKERLKFKHLTHRALREQERQSQLTFLLSSISCSNMALNTGERAGTERNKRPRQRKEGLLLSVMLLHGEVSDIR